MSEQQNDAVAMLGDFLELLVEYFRLFGDKPCCANDIILFLDYLEPIRHAELASRLLTVCEITPTTLPRSVSSFSYIFFMWQLFLFIFQIFRRENKCRNIFAHYKFREFAVHMR